MTEIRRFFVFDDCFGDAPSVHDIFSVSGHTRQIFLKIFLEGKEIAENTSISTMSCTTHNEYQS